MKTIGIVGGGQLGRMLTDAAHRLGFLVIVLDPTPNSPAGLVADKQIIGGYKDEHATRLLASEVDFITIDAEFINTEVLLDLEKKGKVINPSPATIALIKDKLLQKEFLKKNNIPTAEFKSVSTKQEILTIAQQFGYPFLLKARHDAYDGRGNLLIQSEKDIDKGLQKLGGRLLYVEKYVPFVKEISVMVARSIKGEIVTYPVSENIHKENILHASLVPARISQRASENAKRLAKDVMAHMYGAGVFGIEMFLIRSAASGQADNVFVNEIAPRVHNSGHYTIEACKTSQFEQHIRAITGMKLGPTDLIVSACAMVNILGSRSGIAKPDAAMHLEKISGVTMHMYGKKEVRMERKMGHITAVAETVEEALEKALKARQLVAI